MSNNDNRVLIRKGARLLTQTEIDGVTGARKLSQDELGAVSGGLIPTRLSVLVTGPSSNPDQSFDT